MWRFSPPFFGGGGDVQKILPVDNSPSQEKSLDPSVCEDRQSGTPGSQENSLPVRSNLELIVSRVIYSLHMRLFRDLLSRPAVISCQTPVWLLGVCYKVPSGNSDEDTEVADMFQRDFESRLWFTYRKDFEAMGEAQLTSDAGWGCMLRSGQMLLAQALVNDRLGRTWRWDSEELVAEYLDIVKSFGDAPGPDQPFSIHNLISAGSKHGLCVGAWLGPYVLCRTLESLAGPDSSASSALRMAVHVVAGDQERDAGGAPIVFVDDVVKLCLEEGAVAQDGSRVEVAAGKKWRSVLILVPLMLGHDKVNPRYLPSLQAVFEFPQSLGMLGGKPGGATYLVGIQDGQLLYLDPHQVQQTVLLSTEQTDIDTSSYHCRVPRKMPLEAMDPSLALAFYCRTQDELEDFCARAAKLADASMGAPMFSVGRRTESHAGGASQSGSHQSSDEALKDTGVHEEEDWQLV